MRVKAYDEAKREDFCILADVIHCWRLKCADALDRAWEGTRFEHGSRRALIGLLKE